MRKNSLRQTANRYFQMDNRGSSRDKKQRYYVIHKMIDDLFTLGEAPQRWQSLRTAQIKRLIQFWYKKKMNPATMLKHMTVIRRFLAFVGHDGFPFNNKSLGIIREINNVTPKKKKIISPDIWEKISIPVSRVLLGLQIHFGLTLSEAMRIVPDIHIQEHKLWLTREITYNSVDRLVLIRTSTQIQLIDELKQLIPSNSNLITAQNYNLIRIHYRDSMKALELSPLKSFRYFYAKLLHSQLISVLDTYQLSLLIMEEMGIKSRTTLWNYLHE